MRQFITTLIIFIVLSTSAFAGENTIDTLSLQQFYDSKEADSTFKKVEIHLSYIGYYVDTTIVVAVYDFSKFDKRTFVTTTVVDSSDKEIAEDIKNLSMQVIKHRYHMKELAEGYMFYTGSGIVSLRKTVGNISNHYNHNRTDVHISKIIVTY